MVLDTFFTRLSQMIRSTTSLSRVIRRHAREAIDNEQVFKEKTASKVKKDVDEGDVDAVVGDVREAFKELYEKGEAPLLDDEKKMLVIQLRFQDVLMPIRGELQELRKHIKKHAPDDIRKKLLDSVDGCEKSIAEMKDKLLSAEQQEYRPLLEAERGMQEHGVIDTSFDPMRLAKAMDRAYQLRKDRRKLEKGADEVKEEINTITELLAELETVKMNNRQSIENHLEREDESLESKVQALTLFAPQVWKEFVLITRVLVEYLFVIQRDEELLHDLLEKLREEGFPVEEGEELLTEEKKLRKETEEERLVALHIIQRIGTREKRS